jgi:hypothetical protein
VIRNDNEGEPAMKVVGFVFLAIIAVGVLAAIVVTLTSIPDIRRYLRIRSM